MKPDYKNWMPKGMVLSFLAGAVISTTIFLILRISGYGRTGWKRVLCITSGVLALIFIPVTIWMFLMYRAFSYDGKRKMSKQIIDGIAGYVKIPNGGECLDIGCGSGALTIAVAKRNPGAVVTGVDRWGKEYASFSKSLCEKNAEAEKVRNVLFEKGDATSLPFADGTFDVITSNYVYHNIPSNDRQKILMESLRTLKKGGAFVIHDIMSKAKYGDMDAFVERLRKDGYEEVNLADTTDGKFMTRWEAAWMGLSGSKILYGRK